MVEFKPRVWVKRVGVMDDRPHVLIQFSVMSNEDNAFMESTGEPGVYLYRSETTKAPTAISLPLEMLESLLARAKEVELTSYSFRKEIQLTG